MKVYFAADHAGFDLKAILIAYVNSLSTAGLPLEAVDCGAFEFDKADDYPDFIGRAAKLLAADSAAGIESRAIVIGASGQGEAMAANRFPGVRCALYYGEPKGTQKDMSGKELDMLSSTREHNGANALSLGARFLSEEEAKNAVKSWLAHPYPGEDRHARRIQKLDALPGSA
ncbi:MAG: RpiB/LacA/LacB family sugar-phosphate isomerase [Candidatus Kaiserbacteria bacterium]|nr:RpiB/LacA/LacB family sugar-phosphate isomerase [Candidatus Kaiserbacteria bacterium]